MLSFTIDMLSFTIGQAIREVSRMATQTARQPIDPKKVEQNAQRLIKENQEWLKKMAKK